MRNILDLQKINRNRKTRVLESESGMALLSVLILTFVLISVVIAMLTMAQNDTKLSTLQRDSTRAFYLAESGIEETLWKLNKRIKENEVLDIITDDDYFPPRVGSNNEYYEIEFEFIPKDDPARKFPISEKIGEREEDWVYIKSTGTIKGNNKDVTGERTVRVAAHYTIKQDTSIIYEKAILTNHKITFQGRPGATITGGDIHSNHKIERNGPGLDLEKFGDHYITTSGVPEDYPNTPYSSLNPFDNTDDKRYSGPSKWPVMPIPPVPYEELKRMAIANGTYYPNGFDTKTQGRGHHEFTGVVYVEGDVVFKNGDSLTITDGALIVAKKNPDDPNDKTGTMEFKNGSNLTIKRSDPSPPGAYPGPLAVAAMGNIVLHASSSSINGVVQSGGYYNDEGELVPGGLVDFRNSSVVTGAVIADEVWMHNQTTINYDKDFFEKFEPVVTWGDARYSKVFWQEI